MKKTPFILLLLVLACGQEPTISEITDQGLLKKAIEQGDRISSQAQEALGSNLLKQVNQNGAPEAVRFCNVAAYPILDSLSTPLNVKIKRASIKARNEKNLPTSYEKTLIEKSQLMLKNKQPIEPIVQALGTDEVLYAAPIRTKNLCLHCHGNEANEIKDMTLTKINELYPQDKAKGHKVGDLRGIWSIRFNKIELENYEMQKEKVALDGLKLLKQNCYSCHAVKSLDHDMIVAPPMEGVKRRYLAKLGTAEAARNQMIRFLKVSTEENALMKGAVRQFGVMAQFQYSEEVIDAMVDYIFTQKLEQPDWFEEHYQEMHSD